MDEFSDARCSWRNPNGHQCWKRANITGSRCIEHSISSIIPTVTQPKPKNPHIANLIAVLKYEHPAYDNIKHKLSADRCVTCLAINNAEASEIEIH